MNSGIVNDIQEQIKTIKKQKQMLKNNRENEKDEFAASINMLDNFKKGNSFNYYRN